MRDFWPILTQPFTKSRLEYHTLRYIYKVKIGEGLVRVGWGSAFSKLELGTEDKSFGYGSTGKKSWNKKFEDYGETFEYGDVKVVPDLWEILGGGPEIYTRNLTRAMICIAIEAAHTRSTLRAGFGNPDGELIDPEVPRD